MAASMLSFYRNKKKDLSIIFIFLKKVGII
jgi:hypothetical protein